VPREERGPQRVGLRCESATGWVRVRRSAPAPTNRAGVPGRVWLVCLGEGVWVPGGEGDWAAGAGEGAGSPHFDLEDADASLDVMLRGESGAGSVEDGDGGGPSRAALACKEADAALDAMLRRGPTRRVRKQSRPWMRC